MTKVFIVNKAPHDFRPAEQFGELVFLSEGPMNKYHTNNIFRQFLDRMKDSSESDYIVLCSLSVMNAIACAIFSWKHGTLNLLLYKAGTYIEVNHRLK